MKSRLFFFRYSRLEFQASIEFHLLFRSWTVNDTIWNCQYSRQVSTVVIILTIKAYIDGFDCLQWFKHDSNGNAIDCWLYFVHIFGCFVPFATFLSTFALCSPQIFSSGKSFPLSNWFHCILKHSNYDQLIKIQFNCYWILSKLKKSLIRFHFIRDESSQTISY